ncbi:MAG: DUF3592 domain-containing protein [Parasphingorhabdus sp.]
MIKKIFLILVGIVFLWSGYKLGPYSFDLYQQGKASESWVAVEANVEKFNFRPRTTSRTPGPTNPHADVLYHYEHAGRTYTGDSLGFGPYSTGQLIRPKNGMATIYFDPERPSNSVYIKGISQPNLGALALAIGLSIMGLILVVFGIKGIVRK